MFAGAGKTTTPCFTLLYRPSTTPTARLGVIVSRKCSRRAVARNRIKRLVRESFRHRRATLPPVDIVVLARALAVQRENAALYDELAGAWEKIIRRTQR